MSKIPGVISEKLRDLIRELSVAGGYCETTEVLNGQELTPDQVLTNLDELDSLLSYVRDMVDELTGYFYKDFWALETYETWEELSEEL